MKVRITKGAKPGDQENFALVTGAESAPYGTTQPETTVKHTMGAIPREEANVEVEGGETAVGDINMDGYIELMTFIGPKHSKGGIPANLPEGTFVFSNSEKLKITDKKLLKEGFNYSGKTATPAAVSKKFKLNDFVNVLRKGEGDEIAMNTAQIMLDTNTGKLAELSLVQEAMKGFPSGIPALAESVLMGAPEELPQASMGGAITKMEDGGSFYDSLIKFMKSPVIGETRSTYSPPKKEERPEGPRPTPTKPGEYTPKKMAPTTSGNKRVDQAVADYRKAPTVGNAKKLMEFIEQAYPETTENSPFLSLIPGFQDTFLENDFVKKAYRDAELHYDANNSKGENYISPSQDQVIGKAKEFYDSARRQLEEGNLLPQEEASLKKQLERLKPAVTTGKYDMNVDKWYFSQAEQIAPAQEDINRPANFGNDTPVTPTPPIADGAPADFSAPVVPVSGNRGDNVPPAPEAPAPEAPVNKPASAPKKEDDRYEILAEFNNGGPVGANGEIKHNIRVVRDKQTGAYVVRNAKTGADIFSTYQSEGKTPGGVASGFSGVDPNAFVKYIQDWIGALGVQGDEITSSQDFQKRIYEHQLKNNPEAVQKVWSEIGLNNAALKDKNLTSKLMSLGALDPTKGNMLNFEKLSEADRSSVLGELGSYYADGMIGVRSLNFTAPRPKENIIESPSRGIPQLGIEVPNKPAATQVPKIADQPVKTEDSSPANPASGRKSGGWYLQDTVNLASAMTDPINRYEPLLAQVDLETVDPVFRDPSRMVAANQEQQAKYQDVVQNSMDSTVANSMMLASSGQSFEQIANGLSEVETQNAQIANQSAQANAQIRNQEQIANTEALSRYVGEMATLNQNIDNSKSLKKARVNAAWNNGQSNWYRKKAMEQVLFPQVYQDPVTGNWEFSGEGQNVNGPNTYQGMGTQTAADLQNMKMLEYRRNLEMIKTLEAEGYSKEQIDAATRLNTSRNSPQFNDRMAMAQMMMGSMPDLPF